METLKMNLKMADELFQDFLDEGISDMESDQFELIQNKKDLIGKYNGLDLDDDIEQFCIDCEKYGLVDRLIPFIIVFTNHSLEPIRYLAFSTLIKIAPQEISFLCIGALKDNSLRIVLIFLEKIKNSPCPLLTLYIKRELYHPNINPNIDEALEILELFDFVKEDTKV